MAFLSNEKMLLQRLSLPRSIPLILFGLVLIGSTFFIMRNVEPLEVKYVSVDGEIDQQQRNEVLMLLSSLSVRNSSLKSISSRIESVSWIAQTSVERRWPDSLVVKVVPHRAIALWNDDAFINDSGEVFLSDYEHGKHLSQLYGPAGSESEVMRQYQLINNVLLKVGRYIEVLTLDERGAWTLINDLGIEVLLGKEGLMEKVQRFVLIAEHVDLIGRLDEIQRIDTRYSNGVAVSWKHATEGMELAKTFKSQREQKL